jgi:aldose 1-epimerase
MIDETEIELSEGPWAAVVSSFGASLRGVTHKGVPVVTGYRGTSAKVGGQGDVLIPFPGRVKGASYHWDGAEHHLAPTDKDGPNAIHGFVRNVPWHVSAASASTATFALDFAGADGYPFPLRVTVEYALSAHGLRVRSRITNTGSAEAPVAMGFHPYFTLGSTHVDGDVLTLPFTQVLEFERLIPTGTILSVVDAGLDFTSPRQIGETCFNHCFLAPLRDADGLARVRLQRGARQVTVWMDRAFNYVVLYTGEGLATAVRRTSLAIEPQSCASDAFNHPEWGLVRLPVGETLDATWGVEVDGHA